MTSSTWSDYDFRSLYLCEPLSLVHWISFRTLFTSTIPQLTAVKCNNAQPVWCKRSSAPYTWDWGEDASSNFPFSLLPSPTNLKKSKCQNACKHKVHTNEFMVWSPLKIHAKIAKKSLTAVLLVSYHSLILLFHTPLCNELL